MFTIPKTDMTDIIKAAYNVPEVHGASEYPESPNTNQMVYDINLELIKIWDGTKWLNLCTRPGICNK